MSQLSSGTLARVTLAWGGSVPAFTPAAWGARAIYHLRPTIVRFTKAGKRLKHPRETSEADIDIPYDRQGSYGSDEDARKALGRWLNAKALKALKRACVKEYLTGDSEDSITIESDGFKLVASPHASYGYLYITAWKVPTCAACAEIDSAGVSRQDHTCGQPVEHAPIGAADEFAKEGGF